MNAHEPDVVRWLLLVGATLLGAVLAGLAQRRWWRPAVGALPGPGQRPAPAPACPVCLGGRERGTRRTAGGARIPDEGTVMTAGPRAVILARDG